MSVTVSEPRVTVSIVTYNPPKHELRSILDALRLEPDCASVAVADNASEAAVREICEEFGATWLPGPNLGYGAGHNRAFAALQPARYHLVLNTDLTFEPGTLSRLADYMDSHTDVTVTQPLILNPDGSDQHAARLLPTPFDLIVRRFLPAGWFGARRRRYLLSGLPEQTSHLDVNYLQGSWMMVRRSAWSHVRGFDERFFMYPEDIDLTRRLSRLGPARQLRTISIVHNHAQASYGSGRMLRIHIANMIRYFNKYGWLFDAERRRLNRRTLAAAGCGKEVRR